MEVTVELTCSNCGHRSRKYRIDQFSMINPPDEYVKAGWDSYGDAFYCPKCVRTWEKRNGKDRPLWGKNHTKERVYQVMTDTLRDALEYAETGEWPM